QRVADLLQYFARHSDSTPFQLFPASSTPYSARCARHYRAGPVDQADCDYSYLHPASAISCHRCHARISIHLADHATTARSSDVRAEQPLWEYIAPPLDI